MNTERIARELTEIDPGWHERFDSIKQAADHWQLEDLWEEATGEKLIVRDDGFSPIENLGEAFAWLEEMGAEYDE